jgi:alcohol dehydrogenase (cytochrome c)
MNRGLRVRPAAWHLTGWSVGGTLWHAGASKRTLAGSGKATPIVQKICRPILIRTRAAVAVVAALGGALLTTMYAQTLPAFSADQATRGKAQYAQHCAACHGEALEGQAMAVPLKGERFFGRWGGQTAGALLTAVRRMPPSGPQSLDPQAYTSIAAYLLAENGLPAGSREMPSDAASLSAAIIPRSGDRPAAGGAAPPVRTGVLVRGRSRLDSLTPVTPDLLRTPPPNDWLLWRRTYDGVGFSPLADITKDNVANLQLQWSWSLPPGSNMMVPLVHDGVIFTDNFGDIVEANDATTGEILWRYQYRLKREAYAYHAKKGVALAGRRVIAATSDMHVIALDMKTGALLWDHAIDIGDETSFLMKNAPLIVKDKALIGLAGYGGVERGSFILALDLETGKPAWRFNTVARPGEPGGDTWNDLPLDKRSGGSVWNPGSYDPELNLVYFGTAPTYNTAPLRSRVDKPGVTNDALFTDATIALDPDDGRLVWYYQHQANDQLDHDWAFERVLTRLPVNGVMRKVVVTGGKQAIFEALDAATGEYLFSIDLGMQNVITAIDPKTGKKTINPASIPPADSGRLSLPGICPDTLGARNWMATAYDARSSLLYIPMTDTCVDSRNGVRWQKHPDPATDGQYGIVQALSLADRRVVWTRREQAPLAGAALLTAGNVLFAGTMDHWFRGYDAASGAELWRVRLNNVPSSFPVTYAVDGRQYLAVLTNEGTIHSNNLSRTAGLNHPIGGGATLSVFALPERK